jgi:hypothetical protein
MAEEVVNVESASLNETSKTLGKEAKLVPPRSGPKEKLYLVDGSADAA